MCFIYVLFFSIFFLQHIKAADKPLKAAHIFVPVIYVHNQTNKQIAIWLERCMQYTTQKDEKFNTYAYSYQEIVKPNSNGVLLSYWPDIMLARKGGFNQEYKSSDTGVKEVNIAPSVFLYVHFNPQYDHAFMSAEIERGCNNNAIRIDFVLKEEADIVGAIPRMRLEKL